jgi:NAD(P)-dependent dehydrogenase (short-subunit alcohol dehydrogenase family)
MTEAGIRFDGRIAIVTGAGAGLGRAHALGLAARGAKVVVNDLGAARDGSGASSAAANQVVAEIRAAGGEAIPDGANVAVMAEVEAMVARAVSAWGRVDVLVCNAGILRDKTFAKVDLADFRAVLEVHLMGTVHCCKAVWEIMRQQAYGRIVLTSSGSGLYGNFGQSSYAAAKMGVVGLMNTLRLEGEKSNIRVNALAPTAATRMTEGLLPPETLKLMTPESITPGVLYLASETAPSGVILAAGAGAFARVTIEETFGQFIAEAERTPEAVAAAFERISARETMKPLAGAFEQTQRLVDAAAKGLAIAAPRRK